MKVVVFGDERRLGAVDGNEVIDLALSLGAAPPAGTSASETTAIMSSLMSLIESGERGLDFIRRAIETSKRLDTPGLRSPLQAAQLHAPFPGQRLVCAGSNFADHMASYFRNWAGVETTDEEQRLKIKGADPAAFWGGVRPIMGPGADIQMPDRANGYLDYEGEPAIVLGRSGKDVRANQFDRYLWGVSLVIDWTIRESSKPPKPNNPFMERKNFDCSKSFGPCILVGENLNCENMSVSTRVNGALRQDFSSSKMVFSFAELLEFLSRDLTFYPGDVISGGTAAGTAMDSTKPAEDGSYPTDLFLKVGDVVEVSSPPIGNLISTIAPKGR